MARSSVVVCSGLRRPPGTSTDAAGVDVVLHLRDDQPGRQLGGPLVAERQHLVEVVAGVDVHQRERHPGRPEGLLGQAQHDDRVLAAAEQQRGALELRGDLAHHVDALGLQHVELVEGRFAVVTRGPARAGRPSSCADRLLERLLLRADDGVRGGRRLVGRVDAGQAAHLAAALLGVQALDVALAADLDGRRDVDLEEAGALVGVQRAHRVAGLGEGRDDAREHQDAVLGEGRARPSRCAGRWCRGPRG